MTKRYIWIRTYDNERERKLATIINDEFAVYRVHADWYAVTHLASGFGMGQNSTPEEAWDTTQKAMASFTGWTDRLTEELNKLGPLMNCPVAYVAPDPNPMPDDWKDRLALLYEDAWTEGYPDCYIDMTGPDPCDGSLMTVIETLKTIHVLETMMVVAMDQIHLYAHAFEVHEQQGKSIEWMELNGSKYPLIEDLRLSRHGIFPMDDTDASPFSVPDVLSDGEEFMTEHWGEFGFSDEYGTCSNCGKILRTSPDSYSWEPEFYLGDGEILCPDCVDVDEALENLSHSRKPLPEFIQRTADNDGKIVVLQHEWENGWHSGMDDDPEKIEVWLKQQGIQDWWWDVDSSQFYVTFRLILRPEDIQVLCLLDGQEDDTDAEQRVNVILDDVASHS